MTSTASEAARQLAALRPARTYACAVCEREFQAVSRTNSLPKTCSNACRQQAHRNRRKAQQAQL